jgi:hypothetical protein
LMIALNIGPGDRSVQLIVILISIYLIDGMAGALPFGPASFETRCSASLLRMRKKHVWHHRAMLGKLSPHR